MTRTRRRLSVRSRLTVVVTVLFAIVVTLGSWFLLNRAEAAWIDDLRAQDRAELDELASSIRTIDLSDPSLAETPVPLPQGRDGTTFRLIDEAGVVIGATETILLGDTMVISTPLTGSDADDQPDYAAGDRALAGETSTESITIDLPDGEVTLMAISWLGSVEAGVETLRNTLLLVTPVLIIAVGLLAWITTGRAFRPVAAITDQVDHITDERLDKRIPVPGTADEIAHLAQTMNNMLDRLSTSRQRQREFVSDVSHELRNPIATSQAKLEVGLGHPEDTDWTETASIVLAEQRRLASLVDDLLLLAQLDENHDTATTEVDLDDIVIEEAKRPHRVPIDISRVEPVRIKGDSKQLARLVRNLIDNASRHANDKVILALRPSIDQAVLSVEDDGPGIPRQDRERVFERFVRLNPDRSRQQGGTGLGLAIVQAVAASHGGSISIEDTPIGGARVLVRLPFDYQVGGRVD